MPKVFDDKSVRRIRDAVVWFEGHYRNTPPERGKYQGTVIPGKIAQTTATIPALTSGVPGSGPATLYTFDGSTLTSGDSVTVYNLSGQTIASAKWVFVMRVDGYYLVVSVPCT